MIVKTALRKSSSVLVLLTMGSLLLAAGVATARTETLRWTHPSPGDIVRFEALVGTSSQSYGAPISLGLPNRDAQGVYTASITVGDSATVYVAVQAVDSSGQRSDPSNERLRTAPSPAPPPSGSGDSSGGGSTGGSGSTSGLGAGVELPASADALIRFDFDSGSAPNWRDTAADNSLSQNDSLFSVGSVGGNPALTTRSDATNIHSHYVGDPSNLSDVVLRGRMGVDAAGAGIGVTAYSQYPNENVYYRLRTLGPGNTFELAGHNYEGCSGAKDTGVIAEANVWYEFELAVSDEGGANRISASIWKQGDSRPSSSQAECVDSSSSRPRSGTVGVWSMGSGGKFWDDLEVVAHSNGGTVVQPDPLEPPVLISVDPVP